jgi:hypothetical protein
VCLRCYENNLSAKNSGVNRKNRHCSRIFFLTAQPNNSNVIAMTGRRGGREVNQPEIRPDQLAHFLNVVKLTILIMVNVLALQHYKNLM